MLHVLMTTLAIMGLLEVLTVGKWSARWESRSIPAANMQLSWRATRFLLPTVTAALMLPALGTCGALEMALLTWLGILVFDLDLRSGFIPKEPCWLIAGAGGLLAYLSLQDLPWWLLTVGIAALLIWLASVGTMLLTGGGLGAGDMRLLLATSPLAAWVGPSYILIALIVAMVVQLVARPWLRRHVTLSMPGLPYGPSLIASVLAVVAASAYLA